MRVFRARPRHGRPVPTPAAVPLAALLDAGGPHGVLTASRLQELGVSRQTVARRTRPGGPWTPLLRGVVGLWTGTPTATQRLMAAQAYGGPDAVISGFAATGAHGLRRGPDTGRVKVLVPHACHVSSLDFVVIERTTRMPDARTRDGVRLAPVERAVLDGARELRMRDEVRAVVAEAVQRRFATPGRLAAELDAGSTRGAALVRAVLAEVSDGIRSAAEGWGRDALRSAGLPAPRWNPRLVDLAGRFLASPDAYWPAVGLAWQIDSREWHLDPASWERTLRRRALLETAGVVVVSTVPRWLRTEPRAVLAELGAAHGRAALLPAPDVRIVALAP